MFLQMGLIISSFFSFYDFLIFRPQQQIRFCQQPTNVKLKTRAAFPQQK